MISEDHIDDILGDEDADPTQDYWSMEDSYVEDEDCFEGLDKKEEILFNLSYPEASKAVYKLVAEPRKGKHSAKVRRILLRRLRRRK